MVSRALAREDRQQPADLEYVPHEPAYADQPQRDPGSFSILVALAHGNGHLRRACAPVRRIPNPSCDHSTPKSAQHGLGYARTGNNVTAASPPFPCTPTAQFDVPRDVDIVCPIAETVLSLLA